MKLPVRRLSHTPPPRTWDLVRREIETYSLMFPHVAFSLEDTTYAGEPSPQKDRIVRIPKVCAFLRIGFLVVDHKVQTSSTLDSFRHLYGNALTEASAMNFLLENQVMIPLALAHRSIGYNLWVNENRRVHQSYRSQFQSKSSKLYAFKFSEVICTDLSVPL